jgi:hypothetical protein
LRVPDPLASPTGPQRELLEKWLPGVRVVRDHSWGLVDNVVLEVEAGAQRYIVKADATSSVHIGRELDAHQRWLTPWISSGRAPQLVAGDRVASILVTRYLPGDLVLGSAAQQDPGIFCQAGRLLAQLHGQHERTDASYERAENTKILRNLDKPHRIPPSLERELRRIVSAWETPPVQLVPTHGDWQPRNWLVHDGEVRVIDFGRAALRPVLSDWVRLEARDFREDPARERAFVEGYGADPREPEAWFRERLREAINTAVWAHLVGDEAFEAQGHAMIERALGDR